MKKIIMAPNPTGTGHNMRMLAIGKELKHRHKDLEIIVLLGSRQNVFTKLFEEENIKVIDLNPTGIIDYSKNSHLTRNLDWKNMITNYFVPTFFNGDKVLRYIDLFRLYEPDLVVSDYNINATFAAIASSIKNVFVTERHNFTLVDVTISDLQEGGFNVSREEISSAQHDLDILFHWLMSNTNLVITDKVFIKNFASDDQLLKFSDKVFFVGSMYADRHKDKSDDLDFQSLGINPKAPYIVATVSSTTMLKDDYNHNIEVYVNTFKSLKKEIRNLQLVLIGTESISNSIEGVINIPYLPDWKELIEKSSLIISHPGWITVTEVSYLNIPAIFYLPNFMEYHEVEAYRRLEILGLPVFCGDDIKKFKEKILDVFKQNKKEELFNGYKILSPYPDGLIKATDLIEKLITSSQGNSVEEEV